MHRLECGAGQSVEFNRSFYDALLNLQKEETIVSQFPNNLSMNNFVQSFIKELNDKNDSRTYEHKMNEGGSVYTLKRLS